MHGETVIPPAPERVTAIRFTTASVGTFLIPEVNEIVWYSGFGGELVTWWHGGAIAGFPGYVLDCWDFWPDKQGRFPEPSLIKSMREGIMSDDVDRIVLGLPQNAPDSEVSARMARKEIRSIDHLFDWAAYAARQNRRESIPSLPHATILAAASDPREFARRAANEAVDILPWH
jgi:hypothetical protein